MERKGLHTMSFTKVFALITLAAGAAMAQSTFYCASDDMRRHYCSVDTRGGVQMARQRSDASCIAGRTWGYDGRGVWVDRGCRADFYLNSGNYRSGGYGGPWGNQRDPYSNGGYGNNSGYGYGNSAYRVQCDSNDMRRHYCSADTSGGVQLVRQRSDASCVQGRTWGYNRSGIWVDRGCRAEFAVNTGYNSRGRNSGNGRYRDYNYDPNRNRGWRPW